MRADGIFRLPAHEAEKQTEIILLCFIILSYDKKYMKHKVLFACPKSTKRTKRGRDSSFELLPHTRLSRREYCVASECGQQANQKTQVYLSP